MCVLPQDALDRRRRFDEAACLRQSGRLDEIQRQFVSFEHDSFRFVAAVKG
jgi:hypothetical protein